MGELVEAQDYCMKVMQRYIDILDDATYMPTEYFQKEKEYGIPWRSAFRAHLEQTVRIVAKKALGKDDSELKEIDSFTMLHTVVKKDVIDAAVFDVKTAADLMSHGLDQLEDLEKAVSKIKCLLKQSSVLDFEATISKALSDLESRQGRFHTDFTHSVNN